MAKVSVIVPAYNSEQFVAETLDCLYEQTLKDIEVIVVNDGSTDSTQDIIDQYCAKSDIFKCIKQENAGVSAARNNGLDNATGEYVLFLDADDLLTPGSLEAFYKTGKETGADIIIGTLRNFNEHGMGKFNAFAEGLSKRKSIDPFAKTLLWNFLVSNKCYNRERLVASGVRFPGFRYSEEGAFFMRFVYTGVTIAGTRGACMCYRRHSSEQGLSVSQTVNQPLCESMIGSLTDIYEHAVVGLEKAPDTVDKEDYLQEVIYKTAYILLSQFYRLVWSGDEECFNYAAKEFVRLKGMMTEKRFKVICGTDPDLHLEDLCMTTAEIAEKPTVSVILNPWFQKDMSVMFESLYKQISPLFQLIIPQRMVDKGLVPEQYRNNKNIVVLPNSFFRIRASLAAKSRRRICLRKNSKLDIRDFRMVYRIPKIPEKIKTLFYPILLRGINFLLVKRIVK